MGLWLPPLHHHANNIFPAKQVKEQRDAHNIFNRSIKEEWIKYLHHELPPPPQLHHDVKPLTMIRFSHGRDLPPTQSKSVFEH
jgi:hypothetical protein